jgi:hypothetical protein
MISILMLALAGFLGGGAYSLVRNGHRAGAIVVGVGAALALAAGLAWWGQ